MRKNSRFIYFGVIISIVTLLGVCNGSATYATSSTLTVNVVDSINVNLTASSGGTFVTSDTNTPNINITTNHGSGYTLGIQAGSDGGNALVNTVDSTKIIPSISSAISESVYSTSSAQNNTWGYRPSKLDSTDNTNYLPAPTSSTSSVILDQTTVANPTIANTYNLAIGARVSENTAPGSYANTFVVTVVANPISYSISYNDNSSSAGSGLPANVSNLTTIDDIVTLSSTIPVRSNYSFAGWCTVDTPDNAACTGTEYAANGNWPIDQTANPNNLTLYAMWKSVLPMQTMSISDCSPDGTVAYDMRDNTQYLVKKLNDGNCWMLDNLAIDPTQLTQAELYGTSAQPLTNASNTTLGYLKNGGGTADDQYAITGLASITESYSYSQPQVASSGVCRTYSSESECVNEPSVGQWTKDGVPANSTLGAGSRKIGVYYNYCAASAGSYCYGDGTSAGTISGDATEDICPAGWRLPTSGNNGEYQALYAINDYNTYEKLQTALSLPLSGAIASGLADWQGRSGIWWSSSNPNVSSYGGEIMMAPSITNADGEKSVSIGSASPRFQGRTIRCIMKNTPSMQKTTREQLEELAPSTGDIVTLKDERDNIEYTIGRLADGNYWMLDNLALDPTQLTQAELYGSDTQPLTNASNTTLGYLKNGGGTASDKYPTAALGSEEWNSYLKKYYSIPMVRTDSKDVVPSNSDLGAGNHKVGVYYNYCAASAGSYCYGNGTEMGTSSGNATEDICPAGWRLPTGGASGEYQALYASSDYNTTLKIRTGLSLPLSGIINLASYSTPVNQGSNGYWWASTRNNDQYMFGLTTDGNWTYTQNYGALYAYRYYGYSIRCVKNS